MQIKVEKLKFSYQARLILSISEGALFLNRSKFNRNLSIVSEKVDLEKQDLQDESHRLSLLVRDGALDNYKMSFSLSI